MKIIKEFVLRNIAGESILIPTGATSQEFNGMINLTATAEFIWQNLEQAGSLDELVDKITDEFDVDRELAARDTAGFVAELLRQGFVAPDDIEKGW